MTIKQIFDEIAAEGGTKKKKEILAKYKDNDLLRQVLYLANSKRVKFYIKQIPEYVTDGNSSLLLSEALVKLGKISSRELTGHDAINHLKDILSSLLKDDAYIIERIIEKDCKIGMGTTLMNEIFPNLIEETPYMGAKSFSEKLAKKIFEGGATAYSQIKMDGRYCNAIIRGNDIELESRQGETTSVDWAQFVTELKAFPDCVLNGELTMDGVPRYESNGIIASVIDIIGKRSERTEKETAAKLENFESKHMKLEDALKNIRFTVWDMISVDEYFAQKSSTPYSTRFNDLVSLVTSKNCAMVSIVENREVKTYEEAMSHFQELLKAGHEGTILKAANGAWKDGKPNWQVKMKLEIDVDLKITGFNYGTGKNAHLISSLVAETSDGKLVTQPTGIDEKTMKMITDNQDKLMGTIVECKCSGLSHNSDGEYSLLHPVFKMLRDDKATANSLDECIGIENMAKGLVVL